MWTRHRFTGGVLALDTANTVVLRNDPARRFDRFGDAAEIARFAAAASGFRAAELGGRKLSVSDPTAIRDKVLTIREATDQALRSVADTGTVGVENLRLLLEACAAGLDGHAYRLDPARRPFGDPSTPIAFETALAVSALSLLAGDRGAKIKICANCGWLFLDGSRNSSRLWCDMAVCGNRQKAKRHYRRHKTPATEASDVLE